MDIIQFGTLLLSFIPVISSSSKDERELSDAALNAISEALTETCLYVNDYKDSGVVDKKTQARLARLWAKAAIPVRHFDQDLSDICEHKSQYWLDPSNWDSTKTSEICIDLDSVREKYRAKLN